MCKGYLEYAPYITVVNITLIHYIVKSTPIVLKLYKEKNIQRGRKWKSEKYKDIYINIR